jgi:hypothetical protein
MQTRRMGLECSVPGWLVTMPEEEKEGEEGVVCE